MHPARRITVLLLTFAASCVEEPNFEGRACSPLSNCPEGFSCGEDSVCHRSCLVDSECGSAEQRCMGGSCVVMQSDAGCGGGECLCTDDEECPIGLRCAGGVCEKPPRFDAGEIFTIDAGRIDGGRFDSGVNQPPEECIVGEDCTTPGPCEEATGASCVNARCVYARRMCSAPPAAECVGGDTIFRSYSGIGTCDPATGGCTYASNDMNCPSCQATCLDPCGALSCDEFNGGCRDQGFCVPGTGGAPPQCSYTNAADGAECTRPGTLPGVCTGGDCVECIEDADCDDQNECTLETCDTATHQCVRGNSADRDVCTRVDNGQEGLCFEGDCVECVDATDCLDGNACTTDVCDPGTHRCSWAPRTGTCNDGNACTTVDSCSGGMCVGGSDVPCNSPPGQCYQAAGTCNTGNGSCAYAPLASGATCNDGNACTRTDRCNGTGGCAGTAYSCNDNNRCTQDTCDGAGGCSYARIATTGLAPTGGQSVGAMEVVLSWLACSNAQHYDVEIQFDSGGSWVPYFTYDENNPAAPTTNSKTFYPCGATCNSNMRFRIRSFDGVTHGPWSAWSVYFWNNCRAC
jgi:hypothetical protein